MSARLAEQSRPLTRNHTKSSLAQTAQTESHAPVSPASLATPAPALTGLAPDADEADEADALAAASVLVATVAVAAEVDPEVLTDVPVALEGPLVPELTAELSVVAVAADVDSVTPAPDDVAGSSATTVAVAFAVALTPTMDRTHEAAATEYSSK